MLAETGQSTDQSDVLNLDGFMRNTPSGFPVTGLVDHAPVVASRAVARGYAVETAAVMASSWLTGAVLTQLADDRRAVYQADIVTRPRVGGYTRMLNPPSCSRCAILAGKWFRWNQGFQRHPQCDCLHIPASENVSGDLTTDPYAYFKSLSPEEQTRRFGRIEARAIREGADIFRVVNYGSLRTAGVRGQALFGAPGVSLDDIFRRAGTRTRAIEAMRANGWITPRGQVPGGAIVGFRERYSLPISRAVAAGSNRDRVLAARASGVRDPLDRATMTAAERRLFDAHYRLNHVRTTGNLPLSVRNPRGLSGNTADVFTTPIRATPRAVAEMEQALRLQLAELDDLVARGRAPESLITLARALGLY